MTGIAREVAALTGAPLQLPQPVAPQSITDLNPAAEHAVAMKEGGVYALTEVSGLDGGQNAPSWVQQRLLRAGVKPINAIVDITNLVMLEQGQPLHAFDLDALERLCGSGLKPSDFGLRQGLDKEPFTGLYGRTIELDERVQVVICRDRPVAIAGVICSAESGVTATTRNIWLESALFTPASIRSSSRATGLRTDASSRYEKGLLRQITLPAAGRALELMLSLIHISEPTRPY